MVGDEKMPFMELDLRPKYGQWKMEFAASGAAALAAMDHAPADVVVVDTGMPEVGGAELLEELSVRFPQTLRFVLSEECDRESAIRIVKAGHQYLAKPCTPDELCQRLMCALELREVMEGAHLKRAILQIRTLPTMPSLYRQLASKLESPRCSVKELGDVIQRDIGLTSKILQIVNSALFGAWHHVSSPAAAVSLLGTEVVKSLVLSLELFSQLKGDHAPYGRPERLLRHSIATSRMAQKVSELGVGDRASHDDCFVAGLLHDVGELVLMSELTAEYKAILKVAESENLSTLNAELKVLGVSHAEIGAYLLASWGLPVVVVEAVAWHHCPSKSPIRKPGPLAAVHIADSISTCLEPHSPKDCVQRDHEFLERCGLKENEDWLSSACREIPA
jgi:putative nucleotidyltransferase with HDIG domain